MARKKGSVKTGGREPGTPNKLTGDMREKLQSLLNDNIDRVQDDLDNLQPKDRLQVIEKLLSYVLPKLQAQSIDIDFTNMTDSQIDEIINQINTNQNE